MPGGRGIVVVDSGNRALRMFRLDLESKVPTLPRELCSRA